MSVRRKSNWYIYFIAFGIALTFAIVAIFTFKWYLFPEDSSKTGIATSLDEDFKPTAADSFNIMTMLSDGVSDSPELFIVIEYDAVEKRVAFVMLPNGISIPTEGRSLPNVYVAQGASKIISVIESIVGVHCDSYIKLDRHGFIDLITVFGNVNYEVLKSLIIRDSGEVETLNIGTHRLDAESMFRLAMLARYDEGESYRFNCIGQMFADLINQNFRNVDESLLDSYFNIIMEKGDTDLTEQEYKAHRETLKYTIQYGVNPGEYYVPYGEYTEDGGFIIAENSITTIRQKAGLM